MKRRPPPPVTAWLADLHAQGRSRRTLEAYELDLREFAVWLRRDPAEASPADLRAFLLAMADTGLSAATRARRAVALRRFYDWLVLTGQLPSSPAAGLRPPRVARRLPHFLTAEETTRLLGAVQPGLRGLRDRAILLLGLHSLRVSEVSALDLDDLAYLDRAQLRVRRKGGTPVLKDLTAEASAAVDRWCRSRPPCPSPALFVPLPPRGRRPRLQPRSIQRIFKAAAARAGIEKPVSFHTLRHTIATALADAAVPLQEIQDLLDHASPATTRIYAQVSRDRLRSALQAGMSVLFHGSRVRR
jgi:site-specific recombinase XerD